ncbi:LysR family transcriptional regulator [Rhizobium sp. Root1203]|uniref:LysR family transcriptional regulator n=1 Tax=Rhizobium sp. Root1203 TaxID=1736427 RepID=UPI00070FAAB8|nr:LysR family transcriptional regulator [Rhizobium sp. Root1203]KQV30432.1 LysR family transcriptional regulator [Rhizobium sp. Root1203]
MDFTSIEIFLAVARDHSVTKAAVAVGRAPSNVTTRIQQLEEDLGVALFSRDGKKMTLTPKGASFLGYANRLLALALEARQAVGMLTPSGTLRVGTMESTAASRLPAALSQFNQMWPDVSLRLKLGASRDLTREVLTDALDCALIACPPKDLLEADKSFDMDLKALQAERVFVEDLLIVLPAGHPPITSASDLQVASLAALEPGCTYRRIAENWAVRSASIETVELGSYHAIMASVSTGNAAGVVPRSVLDLMHWPTKTPVHSVGLVETLLVYRKDNLPSAFSAFQQVLNATKGRDRRMMAA